MGLPPMFAPRVARAHALAPRLPLIWQELQSCSGNGMASLRSADPDPSDLFLALVSLEYDELLMAPSGQAAEDVLDAAIARHDGRYLAVFEGSVPVGDDGAFLTLGAAGETGARRVERIAAHAAAVINVGTCAAFGGIPAARPDPTTALGVGRFLGDRGVHAQVVNLPGCPVSSTNLVGTLLEYTMFGRLPSLDAFGRPRWAYQHRVHDMCERRGHFEAGEFVEGWTDSAGLARGLCLFQVGCKGPKAYNNCPVVRFNDGTSWPIMAGHGCIGCSEPGFWDALTPFEEPLPGPRRRGRGAR
jgi:NiFe hydrogenase small subunit HydA